MLEISSGPLLLTGASGVVGSELVKCYQEDQLLLAHHRSRPSGSFRQVAIDIRQPQLGLSDTDYGNLAGEISGIIHCAAVTDMNGVPEGLHETNIDGVRHICDLTKEAGVPLHYVSTAFCSKDYGPKQPVTSAYVDSKRSAEAVVRESGVDWTISRPSIVVGNSKSGEIASFQGFHLFVNSILRGRLPIVPLGRSAICDFVPVDYVAQALAKIVATPEFGKTYWLTSGDRAITFEEMLDYGKPFAKEFGNDLSDLVIADAETVREKHLAALSQKLSGRIMDRLAVMMDISKVMTIARHFPSDIADLLPDVSPLDGAALRKTLGQNLYYWGEANQHRFQVPV